MADSGAGHQRETVFCHQCQNEWPRDEGGLTCPRCESEFTEIVEQDNDPRQAHADDVLYPDDAPSPAQRPLHDHNPWPEPHSPHHHHAQDDGPWSSIFRGQGDGHFVQRSTHGRLPHGGMQYTWTTYRSASPRERQEEGAPGSPIIEDFHRMIMDMTGASPPPMMGRSPMVNPTRRRSASPLGDARSPTRPRSSGMVDVVVGMHPAETPQQTPGGGRFAYNSTERLWPRDANSPQPHVHPVGDLQGLLQMLMQNLSGMPGGTPQQDTPEGGPRPPNPFAALFTPFLNPAAASHGDAVYTQEALDRVISQLMEQNPSSNAPGPASEAAIASLPKKKVDLSMLSDEGKADCSVCMDEVPIGEEVTSLPCSHWFHEQCATMWLKEHDTCPICRKGIMPKQGDGNQPRNPRQQPLNMEPWLRTGNEEGNMGMPGPFGFPPMRPGGPNVGSENSAHLRPHGHGGSQQSSSSTGGRRQSRSEDRRSSRGNGDSSSGSGIGDRMRGWFNGSGN